MKVKLITAISLIFIFLCAYLYLFAIIVVVDTRNVNIDISELTCSSLNKTWEFGHIRAEQWKLRLITLKPGGIVLCNIKTSGYQQREFVAIGYFYHTQKALSLELKNSGDGGVFIVASTTRWDNIKSKPSNYVLEPY
ncbi:MAG: hypothetical protein P8X74_14535 [Reinekea sp.]